MNVNAVAIQDDLTFIGPKDQVFIAYEKFKQSIEELKLELQPSKCNVLLPKRIEKEMENDYENSELIESIIATCGQLHLNPCDDSMKILGIYFSHNPNSIQNWCMGTVKSQTDSILKFLSHPKLPTQIANTLLTYSALPRMNYISRTVRPDLLKNAAKKFDEYVMNTFLSILDIKNKELQWEQPALNQNLNGNLPNFHLFFDQIRLPIRYGGFGVRSLETVSHSAYFASFLSALPELLKMSKSSKLISPSNLISSSTSINTNSPLNPVLIECENEFKIAKESQIDMEKILNCDNGKQLLHQAQSASYLGNTNKVQWKFTDQIEQRIYRNLTENVENNFKNASSNDEKSKWKAIKNRHASLSNANSARWMTVNMEHRQKQFFDVEFRSAARLRLGLPPSFLRSIKIQKSSNNQSGNESENLNYICVCGENLLRNPTHILTCNRIEGGSRIHRHDLLMKLIADRLRFLFKDYWKSISQVIVEPSHKLNQFRMNRKKNSNVEDRRHGDILVRIGLKQYLIDVSVVQSDSNSNNSIANIASPSKAIERTESLKVSKYADQCNDNIYSMVPFIVDSYGEIGTKGLKFLSEMSLLSDENPKEWLKDTLDLISCTLQKGNANMVQTSFLHLANSSKPILKSKSKHHSNQFHTKNNRKSNRAEIDLTDNSYNNNYLRFGFPLC